MHPELTGVWMHFLVYSLVKELLTVFFIITFIGTPMAQIIPCIFLSFLSVLFLAYKRPYKRKLNNILNTVVELSYFLIYIAFLNLQITRVAPENLGNRSTIGVLMILLIIVIFGRCLVDLVASLIEFFQYIKKYCVAKNKVAPKNMNANKNSENINAKSQ